jgi:RNA polymerase sigma factor (sigma-70 family)
VPKAERWQHEDVGKLAEVARKVADSMLRRFELPEGQAQEIALEILLRNLDQQVDCTGEAFSFFAVSLVNRARSWKRHQRVVAEYKAKAALEEPQTGAEPDGGEAAAKVARAWALLTPKEQKIFVAVADDEPREAIAERLQISRAGIDQIISRARKKLQSQGLP